MELQPRFLHLKHLFASEAIRIQLPSEHYLFTQATQTWNLISTSTESTKNSRDYIRLFTFCKNLMLLKRLQNISEIIGSIEISLHKFLEKKRKIFPRLYFLANEELMSFLAISQDPRALTPHLRKVFPHVSGLEVDSLSRVTHLIAGGLKQGNNSSHNPSKLNKPDSLSSPDRLLVRGGERLELGSMVDIKRSPGLEV